MKSLCKGILLAGLMLSPALQALTLDQAREQGRVGETFSGYIAARQQDKETLALVGQINEGRRAQYQKLAEEHAMSRDEIARIAAQKLIERARTGEFVRGINGQWLQK